MTKTIGQDDAEEHPQAAEGEVDREQVEDEGGDQPCEEEYDANDPQRAPANARKRRTADPLSTAVFSRDRARSYQAVPATACSEARAGSSVGDRAILRVPGWSGFGNTGVPTQRPQGIVAAPAER